MGDADADAEAETETESSEERRMENGERRTGGKPSERKRGPCCFHASYSSTNNPETSKRRFIAGHRVTVMCLPAGAATQVPRVVQSVHSTSLEKPW